MAYISSEVKKGIWDAEAPEKCKEFLWRACEGGLPVKSLLLQKGIIENDDTCPCCGTCQETTTHALLLCNEVKPIWFASPLGLRVESLLHNKITMANWVFQCVKILDRKVMGLVCAIVWSLWHKRNALVLRKKKLDLSQVMDKAWYMLLPEEWVPPKFPKYKANFASSVRKNVGTGLAVMVSDCKGELLASATKVLEKEYYDLEIAEALCYKFAVEKSKDLWYLDIVFETDCQELYTQWKQFRQGNNTGDDSYMNEILEECSTMMQGKEASLTLVAHSANEVAQCLASLTFESGENVWINEEK